MKKFSSLLALLAILLMIAGSVMSEAVMTISEEKFDFGYVPQNSKISHDFWLYSTGDDSLFIKKIVPG